MTEYSPTHVLPVIDLPVELLHRSTSFAPPIDRFAVSETTTYHWSLEQDIHHFSKEGISGIGVWRSKLNELCEERAAELLQESGLTVSSLSYAGGFTGANGMSFDEAVGDGIEAVFQAKQIGAQCLVVTTGPRGGHTRNHARNLVVDGLRNVGDVAGDFGIKIAVQPMHHVYRDQWTFLNELDETLELIDRCNHPQIGLSFGTMHVGAERKLRNRIADIVKHVLLVRLGDRPSKVGAESDMCLLGHGVIRLQEIVAALLDAGYSGFFEADIWSERVWKSDYTKVLDHTFRQFNSLFLD